MSALSSGSSRPTWLAHTQIVHYGDHACSALGDVFGPAPGFRGIHRAGQRDFAMCNVDLDLGRFVRQLGGQPLADIALDAPVVVRSSSRKLP